MTQELRLFSIVSKILEREFSSQDAGLNLESLALGRANEVKINHHPPLTQIRPGRKEMPRIYVQKCSISGQGGSLSHAESVRRYKSVPTMCLTSTS